MILSDGCSPRAPVIQWVATMATHIRHGRTPDALLVDELLSQYVCVPAVLGKLTQQCGPGRHQRPARLLFGQPVQAAIELTAVLVEEHLELDPGWLADDVLGGRR
jgi:hypothetical protein